MPPSTLADFPSWEDAPAKLLASEAHCGLLTTWGVATYFRKRLSAAALIERCGHTRRDGVFTIGIACALAELGIRVDFHSEPDPDLKPIERRLYRRGKRLGVRLLQAAPVATLLAATRNGGMPIVFYGTSEGEGHFSPLLGIDDDGNLQLPYDDEGSLPRKAFTLAWRAKGICRQALVVRPHRA